MKLLEHTSTYRTHIEKGGKPPPKKGENTLSSPLPFYRYLIIARVDTLTTSRAVQGLYVVVSIVPHIFASFDLAVGRRTAVVASRRWAAAAASRNVSVLSLFLYT